MLRLIWSLLLVVGLAAPSFAAERAPCVVCVTLEGTKEPEEVHAWRTVDGVRYAVCSEECAKKFDAEPAAWLPPEFPRPAPALDAVDFAGKPLGLDAFKGKVVLLDFWATWCAPCRKSMPDLQALHAKFGSRGLVVLGVSIDEGKAKQKARDLVAKKKYGYRFAFDDAAWQRYGVKAIPAAFLLDRQGQIVAQWTGLPADPAELEEKIAALLP
jgi:thiol-disulfide isomerase/thioredoxin